MERRDLKRETFITMRYFKNVLSEVMTDFRVKILN